MDAPRQTPSVRIALEDPELDRISVIYPGTRRYSIAERIEAVPVRAIEGGMKGLFLA